ncbi:MAG TPA: addiction module protein [Longimicrobium sp.]|nr:addiction module protein [Longimicrobium sp.]
MDASIESLCALPLRKRIEIVEALMVSIEREAGPDVWPISDEVIEESLRELEAHDADPSSSIPWETVRAELMKKYG